MYLLDKSFYSTIFVVISLICNTLGIVISSVYVYNNTPLPSYILFTLSTADLILMSFVISSLNSLANINLKLILYEKELITNIKDLEKEVLKHNDNERPTGETRL